MNDPAMKIGILLAGHAPEQLLDRTGDYDAMFRQLLAGHGFSFETFNVVDMEFPDRADACDGWLITGSRHGVYEDHPFIAPLEALIRDAYGADIPVVGICFGHQIIAQALGGKVEKFAGGWAVGPQSYDWEGETVALNAWHQDQVTALPEGAQVLAGNGFCRYAALAYGKRAWSVQPHPEYDAAFMEGLIRYRGPGVVPDEQMRRGLASLDKPVDSPAIATRIARFFKERIIA